jgi:hypothetical protein
MTHCNIIWLILVVKYLKSKCPGHSGGFKRYPQLLYNFGNLINPRKDLGVGDFWFPLFVGSVMEKWMFCRHLDAKIIFF